MNSHFDRTVVRAIQHKRSGEISVLAAETSFYTAPQYFRLLICLCSFEAQKNEKAPARIHFLPLARFPPLQESEWGFRVERQNMRYVSANHLTLKLHALFAPGFLRSLWESKGWRKWIRGRLKNYKPQHASTFKKLFCSAPLWQIVRLGSEVVLSVSFSDFQCSISNCPLLIIVHHKGIPCGERTKMPPIEATTQNHRFS